MIPQTDLIRHMYIGFSLPFYSGNSSSRSSSGFGRLTLMPFPNNTTFTLSNYMRESVTQLTRIKWNKNKQGVAIKENTLKQLLGLPQRCKLTFWNCCVGAGLKLHESRDENHTRIRTIDAPNVRLRELTMSFDCTARTQKQKLLF